MTVIAIAEARRRLPELVRKIVEGHPPIIIGRRGRPEAVLAVPAVAAKAVKRRPLVGLGKLVGTPQELRRTGEQMVAEMEGNLDRTARLIEEGPTRRKRRRRGVRRSA